MILSIRVRSLLDASFFFFFMSLELDTILLVLLLLALFHQVGVIGDSEVSG